MTPMPPTRGMTLIEAVLALALLTGGLLALAGMVVSTSKLARESTERAHAQSAAEARLSELRTLLHRVSWTDPVWNPAIHDAQFGLLAGEHGRSVQLDLLDDSNGGQARIPATLTTYVFSTDEVAVAQPVGLGDTGGLGLGAVDLDANGSTTDTAVGLSGLVVAGVKVEVTWRPGDWKVGDPDTVVRVVSLLH